MFRSVDENVALARAIEGSGEARCTDGSVYTHVWLFNDFAGVVSPRCLPIMTCVEN